MLRLILKMRVQHQMLMMVIVLAPLNVPLQMNGRKRLHKHTRSHNSSNKDTVNAARKKVRFTKGATKGAATIPVSVEPTGVTNTIAATTRYT
jgi:hypothetical protein